MSNEAEFVARIFNGSVFNHFPDESQFDLEDVWLLLSRKIRPSDYRLLVMRFREGKSFKEIAEILASKDGYSNLPSRASKRVMRALYATRRHTREILKLCPSLVGWLESRPRGTELDDRYRMWKVCPAMSMTDRIHEVYPDISEKWKLEWPSKPSQSRLVLDSLRYGFF